CGGCGAIDCGECDMDPKTPERPAAAAQAKSSAGDPASLSDDQLVALYCRDRTAAVCALVAARHGQMVFRTCLRRLANVHDAEDATQAVFLTFVQRPDRVRGPLGAWLHEVARQTVHNLLRGRLRQKQREAAQANKAEPAMATSEMSEELDA